MRIAGCAREQDLLDAIAAARWPDRADAELRAHVEGCPACADTLVVALPLISEGELAHATAHVPSSGIVWWRAQMRARQEAARAASRPITIIQAIAFACAAALVAGSGLWLLPGARQWLGWLREVGLRVGGDAGFAGIQAIAPSGLLAWAVLAFWLVLAPVAVYFALTSD